MRLSSAIPSHVLLTPNGKRRGRKPGLNSTVAQRSAANARERSRMRVLSGAFVELKGALPWVPKDTKLSKLDTLKLASGYIAYLKRILDHTGPNDYDSTLNNDQLYKTENAKLFNLVSPSNKSSLNSDQHFPLSDYRSENYSNKQNQFLFDASCKIAKRDSFSISDKYEESAPYLDTDGCYPENFETLTRSSIDSTTDSSDPINHLFDSAPINYVNSKNSLPFESNWQTPLWSSGLESLKIKKSIFDATQKLDAVHPTWMIQNEQQLKTCFEHRSDCTQSDYFSQSFVK